MKKPYKSESAFVSLHVDADSPRKLLKFWGFSEDVCSPACLDNFYKLSMERALSMFKELGVNATFFCVGQELNSSESARDFVRTAFADGNEIANHTHSHPFGLTKLDRKDIVAEIEECSKAIENITGTRPAGFRSPGYDIDNSVLELLEEMSFKYDASGFWSILNPLSKLYHRVFRINSIQEGYGQSSRRLPCFPYRPSKYDWLTNATPSRKIVEIPLPRTAMLGLPFYNNFHLFSGKFYRKVSISLMRQQYFVYLLHLIEFVDFDDGIPRELRNHPNLKIKARIKLDTMKDTIRRIMKRYEVIRSDRYIDRCFSSGSADGENRGCR